MSQINFRYFYDMFQNEFRKKAYVLKQQRIGELDDDLEDLDNLFDIYFTNVIAPEERINLYDEILFEICANYVSLSGMNLTIYPKTSFEFVDLILSAIQLNDYLESFLWSIQYIFHDYFEYLGKGSAIIRGREDDELPPTYIITINERNEIREFDAVNMDELEATQTMLRILTLEKNGGVGPIPNVVYKYDKNMY